MKLDILLHDKPNGGDTECVGVFKGNRDAAEQAAFIVSVLLQTIFKISKKILPQLKTVPTTSNFSPCTEPTDLSVQKEALESPQNTKKLNYCENCR